MGASNVIKVISWILIVLLLIGAAGAIVRLADDPDNGGIGGDNTDPTEGDFMLEINERNIVGSAQGFKVATDIPLSVTVKYGDTDKQAEGYTLAIVPNKLSGKDFDFTLDGQPYSYHSETDLTKGFNIEYDGDTFVITPKGDPQGIMQAIYPGKLVSGMNAGAYTDMFLLVVTSGDGTDTVKIGFTVNQPVTGVVLTPNEIVF